MFPPFRSTVSRVLALHTPPQHLVRQWTSYRYLTVTSHKSEGHVTPTPDDNVMEKIEQRWYQRLQDQLEKQERKQDEQLKMISVFATGQSVRPEGRTRTDYGS